MNRRQEDGYRTTETRTEERTTAFDTHFSLSFSDGLKKAGSSSLSPGCDGCFIIW